MLYYNTFGRLLSWRPHFPSDNEEEFRVLDVKREPAQTVNKDDVDSGAPNLLVRNNSKLDKLGVWITSLCALHCLALPILIAITPIIASTFFAAEWFERTILSFSILIGFVALFIGFHKYHRQLYPLYSLALGAIIYWNKHAFGEAYEPITIALGALFIIGAHVLNLRLCKSCRKCKTC